jgi:protein-S-isoprenylcysteine O-methyltransferase Ste14
VRILYVAATAAAVLMLERRTGRWEAQPALTAAGVLLAAAGAALHVRARRALGALWSDVIAVRARHEVVDHGPYARVRHPLYLGLLLLAAGTLCAHPSPATVCVAVGTAAGVALKIPLEERALRRTLGEAYARYAARVPALVPRLFRRGKP